MARLRILGFKASMCNSIFKDLQNLWRRNQDLWQLQAMKKITPSWATEVAMPFATTKSDTQCRDTKFLRPEEWVDFDEIEVELS